MLLGRALFAASRDVAAGAGLVTIDATIGTANAAGLAYYAAMGFQTLREPDGSVCKRYHLAPVSVQPVEARARLPRAARRAKQSDIK